MTKPTLAALSLIAWLMLPQTAHCLYNPSTGRWLSRDPIGEKGGLNIYVFVGNRSVLRTDFLGLLVFDKRCTPAEQSSMKKALEERCKLAKQNNCFRCLSKKFKRAMEDFCDSINDPKKQPYVFCDDQQSKPTECGASSTWGGWTDGLQRIHICMNKHGPFDMGCDLLHEGAHAAGKVGDDGDPTKPGSDNRAYAITKCAGCAVNPKFPLPPGY
jgi:hypothetical protein